MVTLSFRDFLFKLVREGRGQLNFYKFDSQKHEEFASTLAEKCDSVGTTKSIGKVVGDQEIKFDVSFLLTSQIDGKIRAYQFLIKKE